MDIDPMVQEQRETNVLLRALIERQTAASSPMETSWKGAFQTYQESVKVATPSREQLAREWFISHPADLQRTGRDLADNVQPEGVRISHVTWNKAKKGQP